MRPPDPVSDLYAGSYRRLVVQVYAVTGDLNEAQEAVQEAFIRVLDVPRRLAGLADPESWLRRVAINVARSRFRRRRLLDALLQRQGPPPVVPDLSPDHVAVLAADMTITPLDPDVVAAHVRPPAWADLARRARRRKVRRRVTGATAGFAALAAAATLVWPGDTRQPDPPAVRPTETYVGQVPSRPLHRGTIPLTPDTAVAYGPAGCVMTVRLTTDAGRTWSEPGGPPPVDPCDELPYEPIDILDSHTYRLVVKGRAWFTTDAGRTWTQDPGERRVAAFGPGPTGDPLNCLNGCDRPRAVDGTTGGLQTLVRGPFSRYQVAVRADPDTVWAVAATTPGTTGRVSYSNDRGRTWSKPADLPAPAADVNIRAFGSRRAYATLVPRSGDASVHRTDNGGRTWTKLDPPIRMQGLFTETPTGTLIVAEPGLDTVRTWVSTDHGATFTESASLPEPPKPSSAGDGNGMIYIQDADGVTHVFDGAKWSAIRPPG